MASMRGARVDDARSIGVGDEAEIADEPACRSPTAATLAFAIPVTFLLVAF